MEDLILFLAYSAGICLMFGAVGFVADYVLPHIPFVERFIDSLPEQDED